ncbi:MAG: trypsin-like peptidase domain-containing protein [Chloroflexota bacterium]
MQSKPEKYTGSLVVMLLAIAFLTGGMWGGIIGAGLVLWVFDAEEGGTPPIIVQVPTATTQPNGPATATPLPSATPTTVLGAALDTPIEAAIASTLVSVVTVINYQSGYNPQQLEDSQRIIGSGLIVDDEGYVVTNAHVVADSGKIEVVLLSGQTISAKLIVDNPSLDLAMLKIEGDSFVPAKWGESTQVRLGQQVIAIGSALGDFPNSVTMGIVSGLDRALALEDFVAYGLIQTDAAINQGNSGGPLVNLQGEVIGINTFMIREDHNQGVAQGISFAIPASSVRALVGNWMAQDSQPPSTLNVQSGSSSNTNETSPESIDDAPTSTSK